MGLLIIIYYDKLFEYNLLDFIYVIFGGCIVELGGVELVNEFYLYGYEWICNDYLDVDVDN